MIDDKILEAYHFWSSRRVMYNSIAGIFAVIFFLGPAFFRGLGFVINLTIFGAILINGLYSLGFEFDCMIIRNSAGTKSLGKFRIVLFWIGTIFTVISTLIFGLTLIM